MLSTPAQATAAWVAEGGSTALGLGFIPPLCHCSANLDG
jgi:hypothetical protein